MTIKTILAGVVGTVLLVLAMIYFVGCGGQTFATTTDGGLCKNTYQEYTVGVPYSWDVRDDEETTVQANGCTLTVLTHYVLDTEGGGGAGGDAPDPLHCDVDGCGGPLDRISPYTDPVEHAMNPNVNNLGSLTTVQIQENTH